VPTLGFADMDGDGQLETYAGFYGAHALTVPGDFSDYEYEGIVVAIPPPR
jgi:hypothetical protein